MKNWLGVGLVLWSAWAAALEALPVKQVADGVYVYQAQHHWPDRSNHGEIANIGFIVGERCVAVIDSGGNPQQGQALSAAVRKATDKPVCYVINTHVHPDHIFGNAAFKAPGVQFVGHHKLARAMSTRAPHYLGRADATLAIAIDATDIIAPDIEVQQHGLLDLGNRKLQLTAHRSAHTDNDLSVYDAKTDTMWLADLLFIEHIPVLDGSLTGWLAELQSLETQKYRLVIPGHGPLVRNWPQAMQAQKTYLSNLQQDVRRYIKQGKTLEQAVREIGVTPDKTWQLAEQFHRKNVTLAFAELEWEDE
jgi:quinoprotein relay system zinc metallohydrolase 2